MKGQINLEFLAAAFVYLVALGSILLLSGSTIAEVSELRESRSLNFEARRVTTQLMSSPGNSTTNGVSWYNADPGDVTELGLSSGEPYELSESKISRLQSFTVATGTSKLNYSRFKQLTGASSQFHFRFYTRPVIALETEFDAKNYTETSDNRFLAGYWRLDDTSDPYSDYSFANNFLTSEGVPRRVDGALQTPGLELYPSAALRTTETYSLDSMAISGWVKPRNTESSGNPAEFLMGIDSDSTSAGLVLENGEISIVENSSGSTFRSGGISINPNEWIHVAMVRNETGSSYLYLNGERVRDVRGSEETISGEFWTGRRKNGSQGFEGSVDELRIYNASISSQKVQNLKKGRDSLSKLGGEPIKLPMSEIDRGARVKYGKGVVDSVTRHVIAYREEGSFERIYTSPSQDFTSASRLDPPVSVGADTNITSLDREGDYVAYSRKLREFGPAVSTEDRTIKLDRYGTLDGKLVRMEVFAW